MDNRGKKKSYLLSGLNKIAFVLLLLIYGHVPVLAELDHGVDLVLEDVVLPGAFL